VAVVGAGHSLTYGDLETRSNQLARLLREAGCGGNEPVGLLVPKGLDAVVAVLGVLKADCQYVPIDLALPAVRVTAILRTCRARWLLAAKPGDRVLAAVAPDVRTALRVGWLENAPPAGIEPAFTQSDLGACSAEPRAYDNVADRPAHILFTSGSTGEPKGVVIRHASVLQFLDWALRHFGVGPEDRHSWHPPLHFDLSTFDVFGTLTAGAQLHLVSAEVGLLPHKLAAFIRESALTQWFSVPSVLTYMAKFEAIEPGDFPELRRLLWCGEACPTPTLIHWMRRLPHVRFTNLYGPTEATIASSHYSVPRCPSSAAEPIPIGQACPGEELLVLDENLSPLPAGEVGDLYIRGGGLSPGYFLDPVRTAEAFLRPPDAVDDSDRIYRTGDLASVGEDGFLYFHGRRDSQIKSRGYRIELGPIEAALHSIPGLLEAAVIGVPTDGFEGTAICCAYAPAPEARATPALLRTRLAGELPGYMLPGHWLTLDHLPKNQNGKVDRRRLREIFETRLRGER
jgi:amino acid adenylation domain-containing protein